MDAGVELLALRAQGAAALIDVCRPAPGPLTVAVWMRGDRLVSAPTDDRATWDGKLTSDEQAEARRQIEIGRRLRMYAASTRGDRP